MTAKKKPTPHKAHTLIRNAVNHRLVRMKRKLQGYSRRDYLIAFIMLAVPFLVLGPVLFQRGYILQYDMVFSPYVHLNLEAIRNGIGLYQGLPVTVLIKLTSFVLPMDIVQKLLLYGIFFLGMFSMYRGLPIQSATARLTAGLMYVVNPFTYDRLMAGHWRVLLAYSLTPLVLKAFLDLYTNPSRRRLLIAGLLWTLIAVINAHHLLIIGVLFICLAVFFVRNLRGLWFALGTIAFTFLLNTWWLIPALQIPNHTHDFGLDHLYAFRTTLDMTHGIWFNMLTLQGFWFTDWQSIKDLMRFWPLLAFLWLTPPIIGIAGFSTYARKHRRLIFGLLLACASALLFAAGPHPSVWQINAWLFENIPGFSGMREPQKFLSLLALTYAVATAFGIDMLIRKGFKKVATFVTVLAVATTLLISLPMLWGANGQLHTVHYPESWYQFRSVLDADEDNSKVVVLPWELYTYDTFVDTLIANPARSFYGDQVIQSQRMNIIGVEDSEPPRLRVITDAVNNRDSQKLQAAMQTLNARYVMITDIQANPEYDWLTQNNDFISVIHDEYVLVLKLDK